MSPFASRPDVGDWVQLSKLTPATMTDRLMGSGLRRGTRGVVLARIGSRVTVDFDAGWGTQRATVPVSHCRVVRRGGGLAGFRRSLHHRTSARLGVFLVLAYPFLRFAIEWLVEYHTTDGMLEALAVGAVQSTLDTFTGFFQNPIKLVLYLALIATMSRIAFGPRRRR